MVACPQSSKTNPKSAPGCFDDVTACTLLALNREYCQCHVVEAREIPLHRSDNGEYEASQLPKCSAHKTWKTKEVNEEDRPAGDESKFDVWLDRESFLYLQAFHSGESVTLSLHYTSR